MGEYLWDKERQERRDAAVRCLNRVFGVKDEEPDMSDEGASSGDAVVAKMLKARAVLNAEEAP